MSYSETIVPKNNLDSAYKNLNKSIVENKSKLNITLQNKIDNILTLSTQILNSMTANSKESILNSVSRINLFIRYSTIYTFFFNYFAERIASLAALPAECSNLTDYVVSVENLGKRLIRASISNPNCKFTLLEDVGETPTFTYDSETKKILTEIILKSDDLANLAVTQYYTDSDKQIIKTFISNLVGVDVGIITSIKMLNENNTTNQTVASISYDVSFPNTLVSGFSLPVKNSFPVNTTAEIKIKLIDANIVLPSQFSGNFNNQYIQKLSTNFNIYK